MVAMGLSVCAFIYNSPHFYLTHLLDGQCLAYGTGGVLSKIFSWFSFVLNVIIPFRVLIYMNTRQKTMTSVKNQLTLMLLSVTMLFLILLCPTYIRFIYLAFAE